MAKDLVKVHLYLIKEDVKSMKKHCIDINNGSSMSSIVRQLIKEYLKKNS